MPGNDPRTIETLTKGILLEAMKVYLEVHSSANLTVSMDEARGGVEEIKGRLGISDLHFSF